MTISNQQDFNQITVTGRVYHIEPATNNGDSWLKVVLISNTQKDAEGTTFTFNTTKMDSLVNQGYLPKGRTITICGRLKSVSSHYFDEKAGCTKTLKHRNVHLEAVTIPTGGLGPMPKDKSEARTNRVVVDAAPPVQKKALTWA